MRSQPHLAVAQTPSDHQGGGAHREARGGSHVHTAGGSLAGNDASPTSSTLGRVVDGRGTRSAATTGTTGSGSGFSSGMCPVSPFRPCRTMRAAVQTATAAHPKVREAGGGRRAGPRPGGVDDVSARRGMRGRGLRLRTLRWPPPHDNSVPARRPMRHGASTTNHSHEDLIGGVLEPATGSVEREAARGRRRGRSGTCSMRTSEARSSSRPDHTGAGDRDPAPTRHHRPAVDVGSARPRY